ncbi:hypothetical protein JCM11251_004327 [Rhodosporidiobolus azoricus]
MRPSPGLLAGLSEALSRATATATKGGASKLVRPSLKFQKPIHPIPRSGPSAAAHPRAHSTSSLRVALDSFVKEAYTGIFRSIRSAAIPRPGPYSGQRLAPRPSSSSSPFSSFAGRGVRSSRPPGSGARFSPSPRPVLSSSPAHSVGLGSARTFSSAGFGVIDNVVLNAPLALRALGDQLDGGIDERKWRRVRRELREKNRTDVKGKGKIDPVRMMKEQKEEFALYFGASPALAAAEEKAVEPVTLVLAVDPDFDLSTSTSSSTSAGDQLDLPYPATERLLTPSLLTSFASLTRAYETHQHRLRTLINRLSLAGLLEPEVGATSGFCVDEASGRRVWKVEFRDGLVTRSRVERVVKGDDYVPASADENDEYALGIDAKVRRWHRSTTSALSAALLAGEGDWWWLTGESSAVSFAAEDHLASPIAPCFSSPSSSSPALDSIAHSVASTEDYAFDIDAAHALAVAETFVLPDPSASSSASSFSEEEEVGSVVSPVLSFSYAPSTAGYEDIEIEPETEQWDDWSLHSSIVEEGEEQEQAQVDPAASVWASQLDLNLEVDSLSSRSSSGGYDEGVRTFLGEVEAERERTRREWGVAF